MTRNRLSPTELTNRSVFDADGTLLGVVRRVSCTPDRDVETFDVELDETVEAVEVGPYLELVPGDVDRLDEQRIVVSSRLEEFLERTRSRAEAYGEGPVAFELVGEPAEDPEWDEV